MKAILRIRRGVTAFLLFSLMMPSAMSEAQEAKAMLPEEYSRPSVALFVTYYPGNRLSRDAVNSAKKIRFTDKYFNHNLETTGVEMPGKLIEMPREDRSRELKKYLENNDIGREMLAKWFNRQENGMFNLDYIHECGLYDATDQDVLMAEASKRGEAVLQDAGRKLINKTYALFIVPKTFESFDNEMSHGWTSVFDIFLFKLDFDDDDVSRFYEVWPYPDDPDDVRQKKIAAFDTLSFDFTPFYGKNDMTSSASELYALTNHPKSSAELFDKLVIEMYREALFRIDKDLEPFRVKVNVSGTHPITSKVGKKEGLHCDQRYFVYEYVWSEAEGEPVPRRKAVVRAAGNVADNRNIATGDSPESKFYQVYGGTVKQGMVMQQRNDLGLSVLAGYETGGIAGITAGFWLRTGFITRIPSFYVMGDLGFDSGDYDPDPQELEKNDYSFFRFSVGLGKGLRFARFFEITPYLAWGMESTSNKTLTTIRTNYVKGGGAFGVSLTHFLSLIGQVNYYEPFGNIQTKRSSDADLQEKDYTWKDAFADREGMGFMFGIRIEF